MLKITNQGFTFSWWQKLCDERDSLQKTFGEAKRRRKPKRETNHTKPHRCWMMLYTLHTCCLHAKEHTNKHTFTAVICWHANKPQMFYTSFPQTKNMCTLGNLRRTSCKSIRESLHFLEKWDLNNVSFLFLFCCFKHVQTIQTNGYGSKTLSSVPRWSGHLEPNGYLNGHDPEVSKAPTRTSCFRDMTSYVYMGLWLDQRSHEKVERSIPARPAISEAWQLGSVALQQFVAWQLGEVNNCRAGNPRTCNHHWTKHQLTNTLYHSKGLDQIISKGLDRRSGSCVGPGLDPNLRFWAAAVHTLRFIVPIPSNKTPLGDTPSSSNKNTWDKSAGKSSVGFQEKPEVLWFFETNTCLGRRSQWKQSKTKWWLWWRSRTPFNKIFDQMMLKCLDNKLIVVRERVLSSSQGSGPILNPLPQKATLVTIVGYTCFFKIPLNIYQPQSKIPLNSTNDSQIPLQRTLVPCASPLIPMVFLCATHQFHRRRSCRSRATGGQLPKVISNMLNIALFCGGWMELV